MQSSSSYTANHFTDEHSALLGDMQVEDYHRITAKHTTDKQLMTISVTSEYLKEEMKSALETTAKAVMVGGAMHTTEDCVMEIKENYETLIGCVADVVLSIGNDNEKYYIHILGPHKTPYPHQKLLKMLERGTYKFPNNVGGLWAPGEAMPEEIIIAEVVRGEVEMTTGLMCSVLSNFNTI
jgi:hypothetical protein